MLIYSPTTTGGALATTGARVAAGAALYLALTGEACGLRPDASLVDAGTGMSSPGAALSFYTFNGCHPFSFPTCLAEGDTAILAESDSHDHNITV